MTVTAPIPASTRAGNELSTDKTTTRSAKVEKTYYAMLIPAVLLFTLFITVPGLIGMFFSFTNYFGFGEWKFVGLTNYTSIFSDPRILQSYGFTIFFAVVTTVVVNALALLLAIGLNSKIKFKKTLRGLYFIPMVISGIVIAYVFNYLFSNSIPALAASIGWTGGESSLLANEHWAWAAIVVVAAWQSIPGAMIIYLAGLLSIPGEVYEAASLDGTGAWRQFRSITFPLVFGYVIINSILSLKNFLNVYDVIVGLTNGGPGTATSSIAMTIFTGFSSGDYAYQMANAVLFFILTIIVSVLQLALIRNRDVEL
jgi:raffinose/stachyose/melibiose transport system permease protein